MTIHDTQDWSSPGGQGPAQVIGDPILTFGTLLLGEDPSGNAQAIQVDSSGHVLTSGGYASLSGPGQSTDPGELDQAGPFTITTQHTDTVGFTFSGADSGGFAVSTGGTGGVDFVDTGGGGIILSSTTTVSINGLTEIDLGDSVVVKNSGGVAVLEVSSSTNSDLFVVNLSGAFTEVSLDARDIFLGTAGATDTIEIYATQQVVLSGGNATGGVTVGKATTDTVGFYGKPGVARQARCVTLGDVISVLATIGITA